MNRLLTIALFPPYLFARVWGVIINDTLEMIEELKRGDTP